MPGLSVNVLLAFAASCTALPRRLADIRYVPKKLQADIMELESATAAAKEVGDLERDNKKCCLCEGLDYGNAAAENKCTVETIRRGMGLSANVGYKSCSVACPDASPELTSFMKKEKECSAVENKLFKNALACEDAAKIFAIKNLQARRMEAARLLEARREAKALADAKKAAILQWSTAATVAAKSLFEESLKNTIVGDCDFGSPSNGDRYAAANRLCGRRDMGNGCTMADMFMGKHNNHVDCRGIKQGDINPQPYVEIWAKLAWGVKMDLAAMTTLGLKKLDSTALADNPLFLTGEKALRAGGQSATTTGDQYGVLVCWAFAAAGMTGLITKMETIDEITTGSRIWWLRETYYKLNKEGKRVPADGHEYLAITRPGVANSYSTAKELFDDDNTIIVDYWYSAMGYKEGQANSIVVMQMKDAKTDTRWTMSNTKIAKDKLKAKQAEKLEESGGLCTSKTNNSGRKRRFRNCFRTYQKP